MSGAAGSERFFTARPDSLPGLDGVWCHTESKDERALALGLGERHFVPPDACSDLIVHFSAGQLASAFVQEPTLAYVVVTIEPGDALFGVRLEIGRGGPLLKHRGAIAEESQLLLAKAASEDAAELLRALRLREAASRTEGSAALAEIAAELGFADQAHLSREMRQLWGTTPARLRSEPSDFFKTPPVAAP